MKPAITPAALQALLAQDASVTLLDVRLAEDRDQDPVRVAGARWRDPHAVEAWGGELDRGTPVVVYCVHGHHVSQTAAGALQMKGFDVRHLAGGLEAWKDAGGAVSPLG